MPNPRYHQGAAAERQVRKTLEQDGWMVVRAAGSRGPVDLVALRPGVAILIQVKRQARRPQPSKPITREEWKGTSLPVAVVWVRPRRSPVWITR